MILLLIDVITIHQTTMISHKSQKLQPHNIEGFFRGCKAQLILGEKLFHKVYM